ncbi:CopD family protein [Dictyobacter arantiisoli]
MFYLALIYLPILRASVPPERPRILLTALGHFSPLAIAGVIIMAISGPLNATMHMEAVSQLWTTAYGRALSVKVLLVLALLATSAYHVFILRPRLKRISQQYTTLLHPDEDVADEDGVVATPRLVPMPDAKLLEGKVTRQTHHLEQVLRWEPVLGAALLVCTGLMNVFAGTLLPAAANQAPAAQTVAVRPFHATVQTKDKQFTIMLTVSPNRFGTNVFTASVLDSKGKPDIQVGVTVYATMLDMDMGTNPPINLLPDGKGHFSQSGDLNMAGHWGLRIEVRTLQDTLHQGSVDMNTPF